MLLYFQTANNGAHERPQSRPLRDPNEFLFASIKLSRMEEWLESDQTKWIGIEPALEYSQRANQGSKRSGSSRTGTQSTECA